MGTLAVSLGQQVSIQVLDTAARRHAFAKSPQIVHSKACFTQTGLCCGDSERRISRSDTGDLSAGTLAVGLSREGSQIVPVAPARPLGEK